jgi:hypothetical protein
MLYFLFLNNQRYFVHFIKYVRGDARLLTYFSCFFCTIPFCGGHTTHRVFTLATDSVNPILILLMLKNS